MFSLADNMDEVNNAKNNKINNHGNLLFNLSSALGFGLVFEVEAKFR